MAAACGCQRSGTFDEGWRLQRKMASRDFSKSRQIRASAERGGALYGYFALPCIYWWLTLHMIRAAGYMHGPISCPAAAVGAMPTHTVAAPVGCPAPAEGEAGPYRSSSYSRVRSWTCFPGRARAGPVRLRGGHRPSARLLRCSPWRSCPGPPLPPRHRSHTQQEQVPNDLSARTRTSYDQPISHPADRRPCWALRLRPCCCRVGRAGLLLRLPPSGVPIEPDPPAPRAAPPQPRRRTPWP